MTDAPTLAATGFVDGVAWVVMRSRQRGWVWAVENVTGRSRWRWSAKRAARDRAALRARAREHDADRRAIRALQGTPANSYGRNFEFRRPAAPSSTPPPRSVP